MQLEMLWQPKFLNLSAAGDQSFFPDNFTLLKESTEEKLVQVRWYDEIKRIPFTNVLLCLLHHSGGTVATLCYVSYSG